jgi:indole-3-glycerol phosphate synthase
MILDDIIQSKKTEVANLPDLDQQYLLPAQYDFYKAIHTDSLAVIAELKPRSPAAGVLQANYQPLPQALRYQQAGANAISVLTDAKFFGGSFTHLAAIRKEIQIPLLCKDFIIDRKQIYQANRAGADACLLIVAVLDDTQLRDLKQEIEALRMTAVLEVFNEAECQRALALNPDVIQINNRNLKDFSIDMNNAQRISRLIPEPIAVIAASGIEVPQAVVNLSERIDAVLIGSALMKSADPMQFIQQVKVLSCPSK